MPEKIILFPFGGNAREALGVILDINRAQKLWDVVGFLDDNPELKGKTCEKAKVLGGREILTKYPDAKVLAVPGNPENYLGRKDLISRLGLSEKRFASVIHPSACVFPGAHVGFNTLLSPNVVISCNARIGNHCVVLSNTVVAHDSSVADYCCLGANVSVAGNVVIESSCYIGAGANIRGGVTIGERSLVGMGSTVIGSVKKETVAVGNPAKIIRSVSEKPRRDS